MRAYVWLGACYVLRAANAATAAVQLKVPTPSKHIAWTAESLTTCGRPLLLSDAEERGGGGWVEDVGTKGPQQLADRLLRLDFDSGQCRTFTARCRRHSAMECT
jgi:hypothetical protein